MENNSEIGRFKEPSAYGLKIKLDHKYPLKPQQIIDLKPRQLLAILPLSMRYLSYYMGVKRRRKKPIMDFVNFISAQQIYGCPLGGIGGGSIGRGFKGEFTRFQLRPGIYEYKTVPECQFIINIRDSHNKTIFQSVLSTYEKPKKCQLQWEWNIEGSDCEYTALYPKAWTVYDLSKYGVKLTCRQISPIIPNNYKDSSLPCAVFVWNISNVCEEERIVNIAFTWAEISNTKKKANTLGKLDLERYSDEHTSGVLLEQTVGNTPCTFTIAKTKLAEENITEGYCFFNSERTSSIVWDSLIEDGKLMPDAKDTSTSTKDMKNHNNGIGLSHCVKISAGSEAEMEFVLVWDLPTVQFHKKSKIYKRYYTKYFGSEGLSGRAIAAYALQNYHRWEEEINEWQEPIFNNSNIPDWLKGALMNELYYIADGGTIWFDTQDDYPASDPRHEFGLFGYLEGHEYRMYSTYDVHFYASFALAQLWPNLQVSLQYMFKDTIPQEVTTTRIHLYDGKTSKRKQKNSVPHDLGDPEEDPFTAINAYNIHDVSEWRDLNSKFILQVFRDYSFLLAAEKPQPESISEADRYRSLDYIDDLSDGEDDLYVRSTTDQTASVKTDSFALRRLNRETSMLRKTRFDPQTDAIESNRIKIQNVPNSFSRTRLDSQTNTIDQTTKNICRTRLNSQNDTLSQVQSESQYDAAKSNRIRLNSHPNKSNRRSRTKSHTDSIRSATRSHAGSVNDTNKLGRIRMHSESDSITVIQALSDMPTKTESNGNCKPIGNALDSKGGGFTILECLYRNLSLRASYCRPSLSSESEIACERQANWQAACYLRDMWPACLSLMNRMSEWDKDGDGLIENTGIPDQTFDAWVMTGPSAYCSGLWLTALQFMKKMAEILEHPVEVEKFTKMLQRAKESFNKKLWDETHYKFDSAPKNSGVVMAGQLTGQWYLRACGFNHEVFPLDKVGTALNTIYANNVLQFCDGKMGAVNGYVLPKGTKPGHVDHTALQSEEVWTGVTYGLASVMVYEGMHKEAMHVAGGMYNAISQDMGMNFETPEALNGNGNHRSIGYMRPLSIWGLYHAITTSPVRTNLVPNGTVTTL